MCRSRYFLAIALLVSPMIFGCGPGPKPGASNEQSQQMISSLESELDRARTEVEKQIDINKTLEDQVQSLTSKLDEIEKEEAGSAQSQESSTVSSSGALDSQSRVALMGAKALAEFKAEQLSSKLEKLTKESQARDTDLAKAVEKADALDAELKGIKEALEEKTQQYDSQTTEKTAQINQMGMELKNLSAQVNEMKQEVADKEELLATLKKAWSDATQLKTAAEAESARLKTELTEVNAQLATVTEAAEKSSKEASILKGELQQAQERIESATTQIEKLSSDNQAYSKEVERLKVNAATLSNKLYALERAAGTDSENFATSLDRIMSGTFESKPNQTVTR